MSKLSYSGFKTVEKCDDFLLGMVLQFHELGS